ncbi:assembly factor cbp4 [Yamadazyma tenuis]|uniref:Cytochrome b mRNA-processing protein 4 n=1 Tax=Candida tenuis (strain ATCC 10573 / BCRC 21748 / CBS 615 / JCM 9827 / NBRC 10315 / NRRL Y-1498 / VKM Y-70) TaxID=590646 RepID=G3B381_CANTC|nr:CBP4-domain-containing protein [Yamadazyma tenuis ATCC 10573]EGV64103.1 CBP4-domain-containing protein [Yamadazyma tenuis ATCC 10573]WEJ96262.1 assembly factor cbp4 [Yamadazyma tenuis]
MDVNPPRWKKVLRAGIYGNAVILLGVVLFKYTTPTEEQLISRFSPEIRADYEKNRSFRQQEQQELMKIVRETSQSSDPVWKTGKIKSPFEKDTRGLDPKLVDVKVFEKQEALAYQREQIDKSTEELAETEKLLAKKRWWRW